MLAKFTAVLALAAFVSADLVDAGVGAAVDVPGILGVDASVGATVLKRRAFRKHNKRDLLDVSANVSVDLAPVIQTVEGLLCEVEGVVGLIGSVVDDVVYQKLDPLLGSLVSTIDSLVSSLPLKKRSISSLQKRDVQDDVTQLLTVVANTLNTVETIVPQVPLVGPLLESILSELNPLLSTLLTTLDQLVGGVLTAVTGLLSGVLSGLGPLVGGLLGDVLGAL